MTPAEVKAAIEAEYRRLTGIEPPEISVERVKGGPGRPDYFRIRCSTYARCNIDSTAEEVAAVVVNDVVTYYEGATSAREAKRADAPPPLERVKGFAETGEL